MSISAETIFLDPNFQGTLQRQLQQIVASAILSGRYLPGEKMPSSRKLAAHLGISRITVTLAYNELVADDYLAAADRSGYFISDTAPVSPLPDLQPHAKDDKVDWQKVIQNDFTGNPLVEKHRDWRAYPFPFIYGQADPELFNHSSWRLCAHQALGRKEFDSLTSDYAEEDDPELISFIMRHTLPRRGILARPEQILVTMGAQNALWSAAQILLSANSNVAFEDPGYPGLRDILSHSHCRQFPIPVDSDGLPPDLLPLQTDVVFTTPSHQCPTTITMPIARRHAMLNLARERGFMIVEDDYEFEMSFLKPTTPALKSLDADGRVIYVGSFSKSLFPGLRLGYIVASEPFIRQVRALRAAVLRHPPGHTQRTTAYFLARGHYDAMVKQMRDIFHKRRNVMAEALATTDLSIQGSASFGGSSLWVKAPEHIDTSQLAIILRAQGVLVEPGSPFFADRDAPNNYMRIAYSSIMASKIPEGIARIDRAIQDWI